MDGFLKGSITHEELMLLLEVHNKSAQQLEKVANALTVIIENQNKTNLKLYNGMTNEIVSRIVANTEKCFGESKEERENLEKRLSRIKEDTFWIKIIFGSIATMIAVGVVVAQLMHWFTHTPIIGG